MTGFTDLLFRSSKTSKEASAGNAAGVHNVATKLSCTARHKSDDLNGFIKFRIGLSLKKEAQQHFGRSLSFVLRQLLCAYIDQERMPTRKEAETLKHFAFETHRIGVNLNQAVKALNADPKNAKRVKELMTLIKELSAVKEKALEAMRGLNEKNALMTFWTNTSEVFTFPNRPSGAVQAVVRRLSKSRDGVIQAAPLFRV